MNIIKELKLSPIMDYEYSNIHPSTITVYSSKVDNCSILDMEKLDKDINKSTFGGHFFIRKNGEIHEGRPLGAVGDFAYDHTKKYNLNYNNIGVCVEGNFDISFMNDIQRISLMELCRFIKNKFYDNMRLTFLNELDYGNNPGLLFPYQDILNEYYQTFNMSNTLIGDILYIKLGSRELYLDKFKSFSGTDVYALQIILKHLGFYNANPTSIYDLTTSSAVSSYQGSNNLISTGIADKKTINRLLTDSKKMSNNLEFKRLLFKEPGDSDMTGEDVLMLQRHLNEKKYVCNINGSYDSSTINAVRNFQLNNNIDVDGKVGPITWNLIVKDTNPIGFRKLYRSKELMSGEDVRKLQKRLLELGYTGAPITSIYDALTEKVIISYQIQHGLQPTGVVDKKLWDTLFS